MITHRLLQCLPQGFGLLEGAAGDTPARPLAAGSAPDLTTLMVVALVLVALIGGLAFLFRRVVLVQLKQRAAGRDMAVLDVLPLGGKRQLAVVRCFDRTFALGLGEKDVTLVAELDHAAVQHDREGKPDAAPSNDEAFRARLEAAKAQLLGVRDLVPRRAPKEATPPRAPQTPELGEIAEPRPGSGREFVA